MRASDSYPFDALTGSCFITGDYDPSHGIVDLEIYLDALPPNGRLVVSGIAVRAMATCLGLIIHTDEVDDEIDTLADENDALRSENQRLRKAVASILSAAKLAQLDDWVPA